MDKWDEISAHQLFNYDDGLRELVLWLGYSDVRSSTQQMHVVMVKSAFAHAFFQGAHRDDGKMNVYACNKREIFMRAKVWRRFRTFHENKLYQIVQPVHINNSPKSLKQCSVRSPTKFISAGITKRSSNAPNLPDAHSFCRCAIQCGICRSQQINVTLHDERGKLSTSQIWHPKKKSPLPC